jgi:tetratricopeptide (TPR) repeat protein
MQGRIAREMGDPDGAEEVYTYAMELAESANDSRSMALVSHGLGGLSFVRGNWPQARQHYERSLELAQTTGDKSMEGRAHRGLLVACARQGDFEAALQHGWAAFESTASDQNSRAELLVNLGGLCRDCGYHTASFAAYAVGFMYADMDRIRIPAFSGATLAAALAGETQTARLLATRLEQLLEGGVQPYEEAQALVNLALAYEALGERVARDIAARVEVMSDTYKYHELAHLARELQDRLREGSRQPVTTPFVLAPPGLAVVDSLTALAQRTDAISVLTGTTARYTPTGNSHP